MQGLRLSLIVCLAGLAAISPASAQPRLPQGWFLDEADMGGVIQYDLAYYDTASDSVRFAVSCSGNYQDVVVTAVTDMVDQAENKPFALVLKNDDMSVSIDGAGNLWNGRYSIGGVVKMQELSDMLLSRFTVIVDGDELAEFTAKTGREEIARVIEACQNRQPPGTTF